jgi:hypothetical protein
MMQFNFYLIIIKVNFKLMWTLDFEALKFFLPKIIVESKRVLKDEDEKISTHKNSISKKKHLYGPTNQMI